MEPDKIIIAIDFGTTYSGVGWLSTVSRKDGEAIEFRKQQDDTTQDKVPTEILYENADEGIFDWGWNVWGNPESQKYFKLRLDPMQQDKLRRLQELDNPLELPVQNQPFQIGPNNDNPFREETEQICTDYLTAIEAEARSYIKGQMGAIFDITLRQYVLTVPAVWSDQAKHSTKQCALNAFGIDADVEIIAEPQAAAIFALDQKRKWKALVPGGHYVVCDAGGGTVDLVTYQVLGTEPLELGVSGPGTGDVCGSIFLNRRFEDYLARKIGGFFRNPANDEMKRAWDQMRDTFETKIKPYFETGDEVYHLRLPPHFPAMVGSDHGDLILNGTDIARIFEPVVTLILNLIEDQIRIVRNEHLNANIAGILLVGGLGQNRYLMARVQERFTNYEILQPHRGELAVVLGALIWGANHKTVTKYVAGHSYGHEVMEKWKPGRTKITDPVTKEDCCEEMVWLIKKGTKITEKEPASSKVTMTCTKNIPRSMEIVLWAWDPRRGSRIEPEVRDNNCYHAGRLVLPLDWLKQKSDRELQRLETEDHKYEITFDLELEFSTDISFGAKFENGPNVRNIIDYNN